MSLNSNSVYLYGLPVIYKNIFDLFENASKATSKPVVFPNEPDISTFVFSFEFSLK